MVEREHTLLYPHEAKRGRMVNYAGIEDPRIAWSLRLLYPQDVLTPGPQTLTGMGIWKVGSVIRSSRVQKFGKDVMYKAFNGEVGADVLNDKQKFADLVREIGYNAPKSLVVSADTDTNQLSQEVAALDDEQEVRLCKPLHGSRGRGILVAKTVDEAIAFATGQKRDYLIQSFEPPKQDFRYILHRDVSQIFNGELPQWRIAYEKVRPSVTGDGQTPVRELVKGSEIPKRAQWKYRRHTDKANLEQIPSEGEEVTLIDSGNVSKGAYGRLPDKGEIKNLDTFMLQFLTDLETKIGSILPTLCVDMGIKDPEVLKQPYDFERMKEAIVFYEFQVPFGYTGYINAIHDKLPRSGIHKWFPPEGSILLRIEESTRVSGAWASQQSKYR